MATALDSLRIGFHSLYVVALDSTSGTINMTENFTGGITPYYFLVRTSGGGIYINPEEINGIMLSAVNLFVNPAIITYRIPEDAGPKNVSLSIYNICGALIKVLVNNKECAPGTYTTSWDGTNLNGIKVPSGIYFYNLSTDIGEKSVKSLVVR